MIGPLRTLLEETTCGCLEIKSLNLVDRLNRDHYPYSYHCVRESTRDGYQRHPWE